MMERELIKITRKIRKGLRKACRTIGFTSNTIKINGLKPRVLLDFFQFELNFEVEGKKTMINVADFIEYYALTDLPENVIDHEKIPIITTNIIISSPQCSIND